MKTTDYYKKQNIDIEQARNDTLKYFKEYCRMDKLKDWDKEYYNKVYENNYYNDICRSNDPIEFHKMNYKKYKIVMEINV